MKTENRICVTLLLTFILSWCAIADAQPFRIPFGKRAPTSRESLELSQKSGPWLIMCASFAGDSGKQQANRLAEELRQRFRLQSYVYTHRFDHSQAAIGAGKGWEKYIDQNGRESHRPIQMKVASSARVEEVAVLVGDFASVDDSKAQKTLLKIKTLHPESLASARDLGEDAWREQLRQWRDSRASQRADPNERNRGPLGAAFLMTNPLLPEEYFNPKTVDPYVVKINSNSKYSLLKNPGRYTIRIATFTGEILTEEEEFAQTLAKDEFLKRNRKGVANSKLMNAMKKATVLATFLRQEGIEAYDFHDIEESYVTVGQFDWIEKTGVGGRKEYNQKAVEVIQKFQGSAIQLPGKKQQGLKTYLLPTRMAQAGILCDVMPSPIPVPKAPKRLGARSIFSGLRR
ncbi:MAG: hypothetical protein AAF939_16515 [Planctomycetota bacterium]